MYKIIKKKIILYNNKKIILETGQIANQSDGAVLVKMGNTILLSTVVLGKTIEKNINFIPLTIDYREKYFAGGKIPGGFIKREGKPSEEEILIMRIVDRLIRPFIPKNFYKEIQIMISLLSYDTKVLPDGLVGLAASSALLISGIPFNGPVSQIKIARIKNKIIINPNLDDIKKSDINLIIGGSYYGIVMVEGDTKEIDNKTFIYILKLAHKIIKRQIKNQISFYLNAKKYININKQSFKILNNKKLKKIIKKKFYKKIYFIAINNKKKKDRRLKFKKLYVKIINKFNNVYLKKNEFLINKYYNYYKKKIIRKLIYKKQIRLDGRLPNQIRNIWGYIDYLPGVHGSSLFTRGETQCLTTVTLGTSLDANKIDNVVLEYNENFYLHYNFPPFSTGEVKKVIGISRREIGHGNLAKKSLKNMIPKNNPYTIRIVSDILESNGSSSMATVCAGTLALMDAGIKIKNPVAGIAIGLIKKKNKYIILSDILGEEDHNGDMDFKITRTQNGITSCQMDIKSKKIDFFKTQTLNKILKTSKKCIYYILKKMYKIIPKHRKEIKSTAPKFSLMKIPRKYIGIIIGTGGKNIQNIQDNTKTNIIITEKSQKCIIEIFGKNEKKINKAIKIIKNIIFIPKIGYIYKARIKKIKKNGFFVELSKGIEALLHKTVINRKEKNKNLYKIGNIIQIKYLGNKKKK
ncbi:MAG: polyribonucleotide nucleotidyltransferase [Candidatus Shikimatogenerans bostrichidophilus]|nr:MAG: polyribonucleotide nucleotidyltransferase [Candidatus Shikimatogenerans bostrichidophilus]